MQVVKLNNRHNAFKRHGFTAGLRFDKGWDRDAKVVERYLESVYNTSAYIRPGMWGNKPVNWYGQYGHKTKGQECAPFWIYLRNESDLSAIMLAI